MPSVQKSVQCFVRNPGCQTIRNCQAITGRRRPRWRSLFFPRFQEPFQWRNNVPRVLWAGGWGEEHLRFQVLVNVQSSRSQMSLVL